MSELVQPRIRLTPTQVSAAPGQPFSIAVNVRNATDVIDAFQISVLGVDQERVSVKPELVSLFPEADEELTVEVTLPPDFPVDRSELWVKVTSCTDPAVFTMASIELDVAPMVAGEMTIDPVSETGKESGRYGVTLHNIGNAPMDLMLVGADDENHFSYRFDRERLRLAPGETTSVQAIVSGRRAFTGTTIPRAFTITAESSGRVMKAGATLAQRPYVPRMLLMLSAVVAMFGLWAVVIGASIDKIVDDGDKDLAASFEDGMAGVVDGIDAEGESAAALEDAQTGALVARSQDGTSGFGIDVSASGAAGDEGATEGSAGDDAGGAPEDATEGASVTDPATDLPLIVVPPDALAGYVVALADLTTPDSPTGAARPIPGASVTLDALIDSPPLEGSLDPNRAPIELTTDEAGVFRVDGLIPGTYRATFSAVGYVDVVCPAVEVPTTSPALGSCTAGDQTITPGPTSVVAMPGAISSIAGIVTFEGNPLAGVQVVVQRLDRTTGAATLAQPPVVTGADGRFAFVFDPDQAALTPGTFDLQFVLDGYVPDRVVVELGPGQRIVGQEVVMTSVPATTTTTTTLPADQRSASGQVTDELTGAPVPNATVTITGATGTLVVATLGDGTYQLEGLAPGLYNVSFSAADYLPAASSLTVPSEDPNAGNMALDPVPVPESTAPTTTTTTTLPADLRSVSGLVTDASSNLPIAGATVTISSANDTFTRVTGPDGTYQILDMPIGLYKATFTASAHLDGVRFLRIPSTDPNNGNMALTPFPFLG